MNPGDDETRVEGAPSISLTALESFGTYKIIGPLARGGMAELSLAVQVGVEGFTRVVALKRVLPANAANAPFVRMFLDEARLAARLDHPQIVRIYELGVEQGSYFMAMEYLPGEDLMGISALAAAADAPVNPDVAAVLVERAAEALHFAHELTDSEGRPLGLVHRDVNPSNLLLTYHGHLKVVDFGIAKAATNTFETEAGMIKGKMGYLAPEQFLPDSQIDRRCDIFGLGIVLWELLTGQQLFQRETLAMTLAAVRDGVVPPLRDLRPDVEPQLEAIVNKALQRNAKDRYQSAAQMQDALDTYLQTRTVRPNERDLAHWLETLGGDRRAELKRNIARGTNVVFSYTELRKLAPAVTHGVTRAPAVSITIRPRPIWQVALFAVLGAALVAGAWFGVKDPQPLPVRAPLLASVQLDSDPPGAFVFIGGEPTGQVTPATLAGFDPATPLQVRLELPGYAAVRAVVPLEAGKQAAQRFPLVAEQGIVQFAHLQSGETVRVAGKNAREGEQLVVPPGKARFEVLSSGRVVLTREVMVVAGPQTVDLKR